MYVKPRPEVLFGDIFEAPYLFDVHLQGDAVRLATAAFPPKAPLTGAFYAEPSEKLPLAGDILRAHGRSGREREGREHRDTMNLPGRALLLSDDCHIPTAYGNRPDRSGGRGRLLFAIITPAEADDVAASAGGTNFSRFGLPAGHGLAEPGIAQLKNLFLVRALGVDPAHRLASLDADGRDALDKRWNAFICRRGPEASQQNAEKLGTLLAGAGATAVEKLWQTLDLAWEFEGRTMRAVSDAAEAHTDPGSSLAQVIQDLRGISALAGEAARLLDAHQTDLGKK
ncbi:MAG TPA: hypothetical protein VIJ51_01015 [Solirubrobacteraceae bacterium]